ncbi:nitroreductase family protein [Silvanigrella aquatica]|uniref:Nitroreductase family protein n=1 Tax=Silvanigrella aquatica TaxID=1915309 RepID=A0A1L4D489_9BACT|nr:nitroreductase family protein [Silvanigrella aquatica]APJ05009.1 nitroreductase family protein [Silvanigrella aquatica]
MSPEEFKKLVHSRRSVRIFSAKPVPENVVNECLNLALLAPNSSNLQPWEFHWVRSNEKKEQLIKACLSQPAASTAAELIVCVARTATWRKNAKKMLEILESQSDKVPKTAIDYYRKIVPFAYTQGYFNIFGWIKRILVFLIGFKTPVPRNPVSRNDMVTWASKTCALAAENLMLAIHAHGFDTCPMEGFDARRIHKILNLPSDSHTVMVVAVGEKAPEGVYGPRIRFERELFIKEV